MKNNVKHFIASSALDTVSALQASIDACGDSIEKLAEEVAGAVKRGGKVLLFGNGGSAADAQHIAAEFVNRFRINRPAMAAIALTTDSSVLTSIANDFDYKNCFSRQVEALAVKGDVVIGISTSGNSPNVLAALETAKEKGALTAGFTGKRPGPMAPLCDILVAVPSTDTPRIQEVHIFLAHCLCDLVEKALFETSS